MHNGTISHWSIVKRELTLLIAQNVYDCVLGTTDSEHLGALYITNLIGKDGTMEDAYTLKQMKSALEKSITQIFDVQKSLKDRGLIKGEIEACSFNLCMTDGDRLLAIRYRNHSEEQPPSLYWSATAGVSLNRKFPGHPDKPGNKNNSEDGTSVAPAEHHREHIVIASEPATFSQDDWNLVSKNNAILVEKDDKKQTWNLSHEEVNIDRAPVTVPSGPHFS